MFIIGFVGEKCLGKSDPPPGRSTFVQNCIWRCCDSRKASKTRKIRKKIQIKHLLHSVCLDLPKWNLENRKKKKAEFVGFQKKRMLSLFCFKFVNFIYSSRCHFHGWSPDFELYEKQKIIQIKEYSSIDFLPFLHLASPNELQKGEQKTWQKINKKWATM